jgi:uncharacterized phage protein (TIGR01671 family)
MRKILFRGKRCDNGEWVEGFYVRAEHHWHKNGIHKDWIICGASANGGWFALHNKYAVKAETVGQFTGLADKNGTRIFEGDVLKIAKLSDGTGHYYVPPLDYPVNVVVEWDMCAWMWETLCEDKRYIGFPEAWCHYECEVIGNAHDNQELLEVDDDG